MVGVPRAGRQRQRGGQRHVLAAALGLLTVALPGWRWLPGSRQAAAVPVMTDQTQAAVEYLAGETLRSWQAQA